MSVSGTEIEIHFVGADGSTDHEEISVVAPAASADIKSQTGIATTTEGGIAVDTGVFVKLYDVAWISLWSPWYPALAELDVVAAARRHMKVTSAALEDFDRRIRLCELHIALDHVAYNAHREAESDLADVMREVEARLRD